MFKHRKTAAPAPPRKKPPPPTQNGKASPPVIYQDAPSGDENMKELPEGILQLTVLLPGGKTSCLEVSGGTPMMDLLVNIAARNKLNPGAHVLQVTNDDTGKPVSYKPNSFIGSLNSTMVQLIPKKGQGQTTDKMSSGPTEKPFEVTMRLTVNFPHNQRKVLRVNPTLTMMEIFSVICRDKDLDQSQYELRLPGAPDDSLNMAWKLTEYGVNEINLIAMPVPDFHKATNEIITQQKVVKAMQPEKKKKGFFSFLRKDKKSKHSSQPKTELSGDIHLQRDKSMYPSSKPQAEVLPQPHVEPVVPHPNPIALKKSVIKSTKKRHAPPPPSHPPVRTLSETSQRAVTTSLEVVTTPLPTTQDVVTSTPENAGETDFVRTGSNHSRHSSDSSGYHEPSVMESPSPDSSKTPSSLFKTSLDNSSLESSELNNSDIVSPQTFSPRLSMQYVIARRARSEENLLELKDNRSQYVSMDNLHHSSSLKSGEKVPRKKRRAPPPPAEPLLVLMDRKLDNGVASTSQQGSVQLPNINKVYNNPEIIEGDTGEIVSPSEVSSERIEPPLMDTKLQMSALTKASTLPPRPPALPRHVARHRFLKHPTFLPPCAEESSNDTSASHPPPIPRQRVKRLRKKGTPEPNLDRRHTMATVTDVKQLTPFKSRPCAFVAPPPPSDPPPPLDEDELRSQVESARGQSADMEVAMATSNAVFKNPANSRSDSRCSENSVNTIEDISLHFNDAIAAGEKTLDAEHRAEEMSSYVQQIQDMTKSLSTLQPLNVDVGDVHDSDTDSEAATHVTDRSSPASVTIYHIQDGSDPSDLVDGIARVQLEGHALTRDEVVIERRDSMTSQDSVTVYYEEEWDEATKSWKRVKNEQQTKLKIDVNGAAETSEITYDFQVDHVPTPFQSDDEFTFGQLKKTDSEETLTGDTEETLDSVRDEQTPVPPIVADALSEEKTQVQPTVLKENFVEDSGTLKTGVDAVKAKPNASVAALESKTVETKPMEEVKMEPEEFIITSEDKIFMVPSLNRTSTKAKAQSPSTGKMVEITAARRGHEDEEAFYGQDGSVRGVKGQVRSRMAELSFTQLDDADTSITEKTPTKMAASVTQSPVKTSLSASVEPVSKIKTDSSTSDVIISKPSKTVPHKRSSISSFVLKSSATNPTKTPLQDNLVTSCVSPGQSQDHSSSTADMESVLQAQYNQLQVQFTMWQQQLIQNQETLAKKQIAPQDQSLQLQGLREQMELQQQMMLQLQQNMASLKAEHSGVTAEVKGQRSVEGSEKEMVIVDKKSEVTVEQQSVVQMRHNVKSIRPMSEVVNKEKPVIMRKQQEVKVQRPKSEVPPTHPVVTEASIVNFKANLKPASQRQLSTDSRFGPKLTPRELLLKDLANSGGIAALKQTGNFEPRNSQRFEATTMKSEPVTIPTVAPLNVPAPPPPPPSAPPPVRSVSAPAAVAPKPATSKPSKAFEPALDPREELMIAIRSMGGRNGLRKVPVSEIHWEDNLPIVDDTF